MQTTKKADKIADKIEQSIAYTIPKWKRLTLPESLFPQVLTPVKEAVHVTGNHHSVMAYHGNEAKLLIEGAVKNDAFKKHLGGEFLQYIDGEFTHGYVIKTHHHTPEIQKVKIEYQLNDAAPYHVENQLIIAEAGTRLEVILDYTALSSDAPSATEKHHYGTTKVVAKRGSQVRLVKVQRLSDEDHYFDQVLSQVEEGAKLELIDVQFGSRNKAIAYETHLLGRHADATLHSLYFGEEHSQLDLSFTMKHLGAQSTSTILSKGALSGNSKKTFRGNLIFETGATQSVGREKEVVVLLDERVKSDSIPALLCSEDDVIGEHAASVGQLDGEKIFYLMSRGLSFMEAKKLVIKAAFEEVLMTLGDDALKASLEEALDWRLAHGIQ